MPITEPSPDLIRRTLGHFPSGVSVITGYSDSGPVGMTVQSFMSLSLDPPMVLISVAKTSKTWPEIASTGPFAINILSESQSHVARQFARSGTDKFRDINYINSKNSDGLPLLEGSVAWIECTIHTVHDGGDHHVVLANIMSLGERDSSEFPLVFCRSDFPRLQK